MWLLYDASKRDVSTQPQLNVLPHACLMLMCWYVVVVLYDAILQHASKRDHEVSTQIGTGS